ncbi:helix-turn-helix transcriptional regulator, partial [Bosea sp. (in: a-proteobacteria)]|uniref:helix-turn-helix transcriptional regulator n=1 Tax=Bosea sp. (in: a-proteobacteria) TaxID=1871050 RepID=UPI003FA53B4B
MKLVLSAQEAAAELGIGLPTLYAYVSRGMLRSEPEPGSRRKLYSAADVRALKARHGEGSGAARQDGGLAMIESALTLIHDGRLYYRGVEVEALARNAR